jgi:hypothetical protein
LVIERSKHLDAEERVLHEQLRNAWHARKRLVPISPVLNLTPEGLLLGAGTVVVPANGPRRLQGLRGQEARVLALLSAAYGKAVAPSVVGNITRAAKAWSEGDDCLAYIHLAHARLPTLQDPYDAARRLFIVDGFMKAGTSPRAVFEAFHFGGAYIDAVEKLFNPDQPRIPAGSGRESGEWTDSEETGGEETAGDKPDRDRTRETSLLGRMPPPAASFLGALDAAQAAELGAYASRVLSPVGVAAAVFGLLFIPSPNNIRVEGEVPEIPGLKYSWNRDEIELHLTYEHADGALRTFSAYLDGDVFRNEHGQIIGSVIGGNKVAIDLFAVLPDLVKKGEPRLCPAPARDVPGSDMGKPYEENRARQYEDFLKKFINPPPDAPTPSGFVYYLPNPDPKASSKPVSYDDCQHATAVLFEFKGESYAKLLTSPITRRSVEDRFLEQSASQISASGGRPVVWIFAEKEAAEATYKLFEDTNEGRRYITIVHVPWTTRGSR